MSIRIWMEVQVPQEVIDDAVRVFNQTPVRDVREILQYAYWRKDQPQPEEVNVNE